jgi:pre-mRNA-splicing factor CWC22
VLSNIEITEDDTTSSSRIFIKILFQELAENMGLKEVNVRLSDPSMQPHFMGIFPRVRQTPPLNPLSTPPPLL